MTNVNMRRDRNASFLRALIIFPQAALHRIWRQMPGFSQNDVSAAACYALRKGYVRRVERVVYAITDKGRECLRVLMGHREALRDVR